jgi:hypothetical protein
MDLLLVGRRFEFGLDDRRESGFLFGDGVVGLVGTGLLALALDALLFGLVLGG